MNKSVFILFSFIFFTCRIPAQPYTDTTIVQDDYFNLYEADADVLMDEKNFKDAIDVYTKAIELNDTSTYNYYLRGICKYKTNDFIGAIKDFTFAIERIPENLEEKWDFGKRTQKIGSEYRMKKSTKSMLHNYYVVYAYRAFAEYSLVQYNKALEDFNIYINYNTENRAVYFYMANIKMYSKKYSRAISDFSKAIKIDSTYIDAYQYRGNTKCLVNNYESAYYDFSKILEMKSDDARALYYRGLCDIELNNIQRGCKDLKKAEELKYSQASDFIKKFCNE